jgi:hypothetical protein
MDGILFSRLRQLVTKTIGTEITDLSKVTVLVCEFVEKNAESLHLTGDEKLTLAVQYISSLFKELTGKDLSQDILLLVSQFIDRIIESSKGLFELQTPPKAAVVPVNVVKDTSDTSSITKKKKGWGFREPSGGR